MKVWEGVSAESALCAKCLCSGPSWWPLKHGTRKEWLKRRRGISPFLIELVQVLQQAAGWGPPAPQHSEAGLGMPGRQGQTVAVKNAHRDQPPPSASPSPHHHRRTQLHARLCLFVQWIPSFCISIPPLWSSIPLLWSSTRRYQVTFSVSDVQEWTNVYFSIQSFWTHFF